jgi:GT2 family glycosyltransferase
MSVVVRTKDRPELLREALESLRAQSFRDFETVLVNDGGPLEEALLGPAPGRELRVVVPPAPGGRTRALNAGLAAARADWVAYLDDDDLFLPDHLAALDAARETGARAAHTSVRQVRQTCDPDGTWRDGPEITVYDRPADLSRLVYRNDVPLIALAHERALGTEAGGFDESFDLYEDWDFLIRLAALAPIVHVPQITAVYRVREGSNVTTTNPWGSHASQEARRRLHAKHASRQTPESTIAFIDAVNADGVAVLGRERWLVGENADLRRQLGAETDRAAALRAELAEVREASSRFREESATREQALAVQKAALEAEVKKRDETLGRIYSSRTWRLLSPWWKLKERLKR